MAGVWFSAETKLKSEIRGLFVLGEDAETNAWLQWRGDERWAAYAEGYRKAADSLVQQVRETASDQDFLVYPIAFLYRHYLELRLKGLMTIGRRLLRKHGKFPRHHDLTKLWAETRAILEEVWPHGPKVDLDNVEASIGRFADVDPLSVAFRYPSNKEGTQTLSNLNHINLQNLSDVMAGVAILLDSAFDALVEMLGIRQEAEDYLIGGTEP